ncbi:hypothetical protein [Cellulomonas sp. HZM]|uniref:hypothetical protein n=1 Tax=Cellulomonas sp. HZM TaxID=1454010 RepID=UPI00049384F8|nr:hypothetical protein [Cellulomonas sp. HZM]
MSVDVTGDPVAVRDAAQRYELVAEQIRFASARLRHVSLHASGSDAVAAVADRADDVATKVGRAEHRYRAAGRALGVYAVRLGEAVVAAQDARRREALAADDLADAQTRVDRLVAMVDGVHPDAAARGAAELDAARDERDLARLRLDAALGDLETAARARDTAALTAAGAIRAAMHDGLDDGWWQDWGSKVAAAVAAVADDIANAAGIAALLLCWVPGLGEVLGLIALVASAVKLLSDLTLVLDDRVSWGDVGWDVAGLVPGGAAKSVGSMARATTRAARGTARIEAARIARTSARGRDEVLTSLVGPRARTMTLAEARDAQRVSRSAAIKDALDPRKDLHGARNGRDLRSTTGAKDWWSPEGAKKWIVRTLGDRDLAADVDRLKDVSPELLRRSPTTASAVRRAAAWRAASYATSGAQGAEALAGGQDVRDWAAGDADYRPGGWHAVEATVAAVRDVTGHGSAAAVRDVRLTRGER